MLEDNESDLSEKKAQQREWDFKLQSEADLSICINGLNNSLITIFKALYPRMATSWQFTLILCMLLMACGGLSLASEEAEPRNSQTDTGTGSNSNATEEGGHGAVPITTLPIVTWKWHHVTTQYLVALWILVAWLCKLSKSCKAKLMEVLFFRHYKLLCTQEIL